MERRIPNTIRNLSKKIVKEFKPETIILFGSHAWGKAGKDSDVDFFVVKTSSKDSLEMMTEVNRILFDRSVPVDVLVYTPQQVKQRERLGDPFLKRIFSFGRVLYEKPKKI